MNKKTITILLILAAAVVYAQSPESEYPLKYIEWRIDAVTKLILCTLWAVTAGILAIVVIISGIKYLAAEDLDERAKEKKNIIHGGVGLIIIIVACPFVNYIVHDTSVKEFKCDCIPLPAPTSTTSTTTTVTTYRPTTTKKPTTTITTTTTTTTVTTMPKSGQGRFLLVGNAKYPGWPMTNPYPLNDVYGVIFNMDGSIYKQPFYIDNDNGPIALAVGNNRFFVAYGSNAVVLDWEGGTIKPKFATLSGYFPVKALQTGDRFYLLLSPSSGGGCVLQVYSLDGNFITSYKADIDRIDSAVINPWAEYGQIDALYPQGDMAVANGRFFIVWYDDKASTVYGIVYDTNGKKVLDKFPIKTDVPVLCFHSPSITGSGSLIDGRCLTDPGMKNCYLMVRIAAGNRYYMVAFNDRLVLYDIETYKFVKERVIGYPLDEQYVQDCIQDITYGNGLFMTATYNNARYYSETGDDAGTGVLGGHGDQLTTLAYGNKMFVGIVAIHLNLGDGLGASFMDSSGNHIIDTLPIELAESPGWAAYDW